MKNTFFLGYELTNSSFSINQRRKAKGSIRMHIDTFSPADLMKNINKEQKTLVYPISAGIEGLAENDEKPLFQCEIEVELKFEFNTGKLPTKKQLENNSWFFENFGHLVAKELFDSMLSKTALKQINLPPRRFIPAEKLTK